MVQAVMAYLGVVVFYVRLRTVVSLEILPHYSLERTTKAQEEPGDT
jgi:hypothetical protein